MELDYTLVIRVLDGLMKRFLEAYDFESFRFRQILIFPLHGTPACASLHKILHLIFQLHAETQKSSLRIPCTAILLPVFQYKYPSAKLIAKSHSIELLDNNFLVSY